MGSACKAALAHVRAKVPVKLEIRREFQTYCLIRASAAVAFDQRRRNAGGGRGRVCKAGAVGTETASLPL